MQEHVTCERMWSGELMSRIEKTFTVFYWTYMLVYVCGVIFLAASGHMDRVSFHVLPFHFFGMFIGIPMIIIVFHDLYKRQFPNPNSKVTWAILMLMFWPSILVYLYRHGFRPR